MRTFLCTKMCWNNMRKIPLNISIMHQTKVEIVHVCYARLLCCLLDHLIVNIWTLLTRSDARWAFFFFLWRGCERGSEILLWKAKTECGFHLFGIFSLFPSLGDVPESWSMAQKPCLGNLGDQQEGACTVLRSRTYMKGRNTQDKVRTAGSIATYWVLFSIDVYWSCSL